MTTKAKLTAATKRAATRAQVGGAKLAKRLIAAADATLVAQGKAARARQRKRTLKAALKTAGKAAMIAGTAAATVMAARVGMRAARGRKPATAQRVSR